jgi:hypothetical protein
MLKGVRYLLRIQHIGYQGRIFTLIHIAVHGLPKYALVIVGQIIVMPLPELS